MEDFVSVDLARKLKEKGFKEYCFAYYNNDYIEYNYESPIFDNEMWFSHNSYDNIWHRDYIDAPMISQVLEWLRKEKKIFITINIGYCYDSYEGPFPAFYAHPILTGYYYGVWELDNLNDKNGHSEYYESPKLAAIAGIEHVLDKLI